MEQVHNPYLFPSFGGSSYDHQAQDQGPNDMKKLKHYEPMTAKLIGKLDRSPNADSLQINDYTISDVVIVGRAVALKSQGIRDTLLINDDTQTIMVLFYKKDSNQPAVQLRDLNFIPEMYVKVYGQIKILQEHTLITGWFVKEITDYNEVTNHFLHVCNRYAMLQYNFEYTPQSENEQTNSSAFQNYYNQNEGEVSEMKESKLHGEVLKVIKRLGMKHGDVHQNQIYKNLAIKISMDEFKSVLEQLSKDGRIFPSYDYEHYRCN